MIVTKVLHLSTIGLTKRFRLGRLGIPLIEQGHWQTDTRTSKKDSTSTSGSRVVWGSPGKGLPWESSWSEKGASEEIVNNRWLNLLLHKWVEWQELRDQKRCDGAWFCIRMMAGAKCCVLRTLLYTTKYRVCTDCAGNSLQQNTTKTESGENGGDTMWWEDTLAIFNQSAGRCIVQMWWSFLDVLAVIRKEMRMKNSLFFIKKEWLQLIFILSIQQGSIVQWKSGMLGTEIEKWVM